MGWATGDFGLLPPPPPRLDDEGFEEGGESEGRQRRLQSKRVKRNAGAQDEKVGILMNKFITFGIFVALYITLMSGCFCNYKYRKNRRFYKEQGLNEWKRHNLYRNDKDKVKRKDKNGKIVRVAPRRAVFKGLPSSMVFPSTLMIGTNFFVLGFAEQGLFLVTFPAEDDECGPPCLILGFVAVIFTFLYVSLVFALLLHYHKMGYRAATWSQAEEPESPSEVEDPLYRLVSHVRSRIFPKGRAFNVMDRPRGEFSRPEADQKEPARTERLLSRPLALFRPRAGDALDALKLTWFSRANGSRFAGLSYDWLALMAGLSIAGLNGVGNHMQIGSPESYMQVSSVVVIQYAAALYVVCIKPSADRIDNLLTFSQFFVEGTQTLVLFIGGHIRITGGDLEIFNNCRAAGFYLGLGALFIPIIEKVYDALITPISDCFQGKFNPVSSFWAMVSLLLALPNFVFQLIGLEIEGLEDNAEVAADSLDSAMEIHAEINDINDAATSDMDTMNTTDGASEVASNLYWNSRPKKTQAEKIRASRDVQLVRMAKSKKRLVTSSTEDSFL